MRSRDFATTLNPYAGCQGHARKQIGGCYPDQSGRDCQITFSLPNIGPPP
jgi:hypothetical protein